MGALLHWSFTRGLYARPQDPAPPEWDPQPFGIPRAAGGLLAAILFPHETPRGVVLLGHPGIGPAKGWFHRGDRVPFLRQLGFAVVTFDHGGFGESDAPTRLYHAEWEDVLAWTRRRFPSLPIHVWGVSVGGYFAHHALAAPETKGVRSAVFEQVTPDLLGYAGPPWAAWRAAALAARLAAPAARAWLPTEAHALHVKAEHVLYVSGDADAGVPPAHARRLVRAAGPLAGHHVVVGAGHLEAWKKGGARLREAVRETLLA